MKKAWLGLFLFLTACTNGEALPPRRCPQVAILRDLERVADHGNDAAVPETLVAVAAMTGLEGACAYRKKGVDVLFTLRMAAQKGPRLGGERVSFPFFVSLVDPSDAPVSKEIMTADFSFSSGGRMAKKDESLRVFIPLEDGADGSAYRVLMGFQLTEAQLKQAREK